LEADSGGMRPPELERVHLRTGGTEQGNKLGGTVGGGWSHLEWQIRGNRKPQPATKRTNQESMFCRPGEHLSDSLKRVLKKVNHKCAGGWRVRTRLPSGEKKGYGRPTILKPDKRVENGRWWESGRERVRKKPLKTLVKKPDLGGDKTSRT